MPKLTEKLTDKVLRDLPPPAAGNVLHYDPELSGFAGRVTAAGARSFVLVYHFDGKERRDTIGQFPAWSAKAAREMAKRWRRDVDLEIDPRGASDPEPAADDARLFLPLAEQFLTHGRTKRGRLLRPAMLREYRRALIVYAEPLHGRPVAEIRRGEIAALIRTVAAERGAVTGMRTRAALSRFFGWLVANTDDLVNPVAGTEGYATAKRERILYDAELAALWAATGEPNDFNLIVRICLWTGCRRSEAGGMRWSEIKDGVWTVPGSRTKNHRPLVLPMSRQMRQALEAWPRRPGRDHLFGHGAAGFDGWSQAKARLDAKLSFDEKWILHDARRTVETRLAAIGVAKEIANKILNHAVGPITETYDRYAYLNEKAEALQAWADRLDGITGETDRSAVFDLQARRAAS